MKELSPSEVKQVAGGSSNGIKTSFAWLNTRAAKVTFSQILRGLNIS